MDKCCDKPKKKIKLKIVPKKETEKKKIKLKIVKKKKKEKKKIVIKKKQPLQLLVLSIEFEKRKQDPVYLAMRQNLITKGFITPDAKLKKKGEKGYELQDRLMIVPGIVRKEQPSKRVMDGWKRFFSNKEKIKEFVDKRIDIAILEDDILVRMSKKVMQSKIKRDKINYLCYQKTFKEKGKEIPVGAQFIYIPWEMINKFTDALLSSKSIHFDRWIGRLPDITFNFGPKEFCEEITRISATTGKKRPGYNLSETEKRKLQETAPKKFYEFS